MARAIRSSTAVPMSVSNVNRLCVSLCQVGANDHDGFDALPAGASGFPEGRPRISWWPTRAVTCNWDESLGGSRIRLTWSAGTAEAVEPGMTRSIGGTRTPNWLTSVGSLVRTCVQFSYSCQDSHVPAAKLELRRRVALSSARMSWDLCRQNESHRVPTPVVNDVDAFTGGVAGRIDGDRLGPTPPGGGRRWCEPTGKVGGELGVGHGPDSGDPALTVLAGDDGRQLTEVRMVVADNHLRAVTDQPVAPVGRGRRMQAAPPEPSRTRSPTGPGVRIRQRKSRFISEPRVDRERTAGASWPVACVCVG